MIWETILSVVGGTSVALLVLGYLAKSVFEKILARDTKIFEVKLTQKSKEFELGLQSQSATAIEQLKSQLQREHMQHQIRFSKLHEKRAEAIANFYEQFTEAMWEAESFLSPFQMAGDRPPAEKHVEAMNKIVDVYRYFGKHKIYFPDETCASVDSVLGEVRRLVIELGVWVRYEDQALPAHAAEQKFKTWIKNAETIKNDIPPTIKKLEDEFRNLLGAL